MSSTAAAEILGIENIAKYSDPVKEAISALGAVYQSVEHLDVTHAASGQKLKDQTIEKENRAALSPRPGTKSDNESQFSVINLSDFLGIVNSTHQGYLSDDVVERLEVERREPKKDCFPPSRPIWAMQRPSTAK